MGSGGSGTHATGREGAGRPGARGTKKGGGRRRAKLIALVATLFAVIVGTGAALAYVGHEEDVAPGSVRVEGVDVSGLQPDEVREVVRTRARELMEKPVVIARTDGSGVSMTVGRDQLGATPRIGPAVRDALEPRDAAGRMLDRLGLAPTREVRIAFTLEPEAVDRVVARANAGFDDPPVGATLRVTRDDVVVVPGRAGVGIDEAELRRRLAQLPARIDLDVGPQPAPVSDEAAQAARARALSIISGPVDVTFQGRAVSVSPAVLRSALRFESRPPTIAVRVDEDTIYRDIAPAFVARESAPRDAHFQVRGDTVRLIPSADGRRLDMAAITRGIAQLPETRSVRARFAVSRPEVLTEELSGLGIEEQVGAFSTPYNCCEPRVTNIERAAELLDGTILPPGRRFSLNDALGARTVERGYVEAPQISGGKLEDGVGGGVSQVATTLFNAAFEAGLNIETHTPHSFYISRYPPGREATISMGGPDLIFVNDWDASLLISATAGSNDITIRLFSTSFDLRVEIVTGDRFDHTEPEEIEVLDASLDPGAREVEQYMGSGGFTVEYTRTVWQGSRVRSEQTYRWRYSPQNAYVKVGPERTETPDESDGPAGGETTAPDGGTPTPAPSAPAAPDPAPAPTPAPSVPGGSAPPPPELP